MHYGVQHRRAKEFVVGRAGALVVVVTLGAAVVSGCSESPTEACRGLASDTYGGDTRFTEVTFVDGDFVKGVIGEYVGGQERTVGHWECSTESGKASITFYSPAN